MSLELVVVEHLDGHGRVQARDRLALKGEQRTFTIGRSIRADVMLDDPAAAAMHARIEIEPGGRILAHDLGSVNGLVVSGQRCHQAGGVVLADNIVQIGRTRLRVRTSDESLEPEAYLRHPSSLLRNPAWLAGLGALAGMSQLAYTSWLGAPRDLALSIVTGLGLLALVAAAWVAFWGLLSRVMQGEWRWLRHTAIFFGVSAILVAIDGLLDLGEFMLGVPPLNDRILWIGAVALGWALYLHMTHASSLAAGRAALIACLVPLLLAGGTQWLQMRYRIRDVNHIGARAHVYPPFLRLRSSESLEDYFKSAAGLRELANRRLTEALANEPRDRESDLIVRGATTRRSGTTADE